MVKIKALLESEAAKEMSKLHICQEGLTEEKGSEDINPSANSYDDNDKLFKGIGKERKLKENNVIEGPLDSTVEHKRISNVGGHYRKKNPRRNMNDSRYLTWQQNQHFPVPTVQELRHKLNGATCFSKIND